MTESGTTPSVEADKSSSSSDETTKTDTNIKDSTLAENFRKVRNKSPQQDQQPQPKDAKKDSTEPTTTDTNNSTNSNTNNSELSQPANKELPTDLKAPASGNNNNANKTDTKLRDTLAIGQLIASNKPTAGSRLIATEIKFLNKSIQDGVATLKKSLEDLPMAFNNAMKDLLKEDRERRNIFSSAMQGRRTARSILNPLGPHRRFPVFRRAIRMRSRSTQVQHQPTATGSLNEQQQQQQQSRLSPNILGGRFTQRANASSTAIANDSTANVSVNLSDPRLSINRSASNSVIETSSSTDDEEGSASSGTTTDHPLTPMSPPTSPM